MKILTAVSLLFSMNVMAQNISEFTIQPGKLHKGGIMLTEIISVDDEAQTMDVSLSYEIVKKPLVPVPSEYLKGTMVQSLPAEYADERGYLELETTRTRDLPDATLMYIGRENLGKYENVHHVRVLTKNGKSETDIFFHPTIPNLGWLKLKLVLKLDIPVLNNYLLEAELKE